MSINVTAAPSGSERLIGPYANGGFDYDGGHHGPLVFVSAERAAEIKALWAEEKEMLKPFTPLPISTPADFLPVRPTGTDLRREVLAQVEGCVCRDRQNTYGDAEDNFADIAIMASIVLRGKLKEDASLDALDIAAVHACTKLARIASSPGHFDNWVDLAGYAVCGGGIVKRDDLP